MLLTTARTVKTLPRTISTLPPTTDNAGESRAKSKEPAALGVVGPFNAPESLRVEPVRPHSETDVKQRPNALKDYPMERIKMDRPPIKPLIFKKTDEILSTPGDTQDLDPNLKSEASGLQRVMAESNSPTAIWQAYQRAIKLSLPIPSIFLDRVSRVLVRNYAPTRKTFLRLYEVLHHLRTQGHIKRWQWNSLIFHSALGLRKVHTKDYQAALDIFREMQSLQTTPGNEEYCKPDITTYTTLISVAIRTGVTEVVEHAYTLLRDANLQQDRIVRLAIIPYYTRNRNLKGIRAIAREFGEAREDIGIDGINAYTWAFGRHGYLEVVEEIYQALRSNLTRVGDKPGRDTSKSSLHGDVLTSRITAAEARKTSCALVDAVSPYMDHWSSSMSEVDDFVFDFINPNVDADSSRDDSSHASGEVHEDLRPKSWHSDQSSTSRRRPRQRQVNGDLIILSHHTPNNITYTLCIQVYAYHNDLRRALQIFRDFITTPDIEHPWGFTKQTYRAFHKAYRALFLGLVKHASRVYTDEFASEEHRAEEERQWTEEALEFVFQSFLTMDPEELRPNDRTVGWIMQAFAYNSRHDPDKLAWVWRSLEERFGPLRVPRLYRHIVSPAQAEPPDN